ncbi:MAG: hypothetical protein PHG19_05985 [Anaerotignum sp.]|nr:hypothetical protein [Anaerotignum sp.]
MSADIGARVGIDGERAFRDSLGAINSQMRTLGTEMQSVVSAFTGMEDSEQSVTARTDVLQRSVNTAREKIQLLTGQSDRAKARLTVLATELENARNAFGENSVEATNAQNAYNRQVTAVNRLQTQINSTTTEMNRMQTEMRQLGGSADDLSGDLGDTERSASTLSDVFKGSLAAGIATAGIKALADGLKSLVGALKDTVVGTAQYADDIATLSVQTGISTDKLQEYNYMTGLADVELETITGSMSKLTKNMATAQKGTGDAAAAFEALGVSTTNSDGSLRDNEAVFGDVINKLGEMTNETERDAYAMQIFGKSAQDLNPLIALGADGFNNLAQEAKDMGYVLDEDALGSMLAVADAMDRTERAADTIKNQISTQLAPVITELTDSFIGWAQSVDWGAVGDKIGGVMESISSFVGEIVDNKETILSTITGIAAGLLAWNVAGIITGVVGAIRGVDAATRTAAATQAIFNAVMKANPIVLVVSLLVGLVAALVTAYKTNEDFRNKVNAAWSAVKEHVAGTIEGVKKTVDDMKEKFRLFVEWFTDIPNQMKEIGKNLITGLWNGITDKVEWLKGKVSGVVDKIKGWFTGQDGFDTHSPSKWSEKVMGWVMQGMAVGVNKTKAIAIAAAKNATDDVKEVFAGTAEDIQKSSEEIAAAVENMRNKLSEYGSLTETVDTEDGSIFKLSNLQDDIDAIEKYGQALADIKAKGVSDGLFAEITDMNIDDAMKYMNELLSMTDEGLTDYVSLYDKKQKAAEEVAKKFYGVGEQAAESLTEGMQVNSVDVGENITEAVSSAVVDASQATDTMGQIVSGIQAQEPVLMDYITALNEKLLSLAIGFQGDYIDIGKMMMDGVSEGVENGQSRLINTITKVLRAAVRAAREEMDINSPSGVFEEIGDYMGQGVDVGWIARMKSVTKNIRNSLADITKTPSLSLSGAGSSVSKSYSFGDTHFHIGTVNNGNGRDTKILAQELEFDRRVKLDATGG